MENLAGQSIDRYKLIELLGMGGMAMVYKAYDTRLEREVAIKIIRQGAFPPETLHDVLKRFEREAKSLARLSHPNIVKILDYGEYEGLPFLVMEYFSAGTLTQRIGKPISWQEAMNLLLPIARGVEYAHAHDVIHRDIKPANILITDNGQPTLSDFGLAKLFQDENKTVLTVSGMALGTPEYMAPEQWTGKASAQSDIYSLGIILYEMLTGIRPYVADTPGGVFLKQVTEPLPFPSRVIPNLPSSIEVFLLKALAKEPENRFADLKTFIKEVEGLLNVNEGKTETNNEILVKNLKPESTRQLSVLPKSYRPIAILGAIGVIFLGVGSVIIIVTLIIGVPTIQRMLNESPTSTSIVVTQPPALTVASTASEILSPDITDSKDIEMVLVPAGEFKMGGNAEDAFTECQKYSSDCDRSWYEDEEPLHIVLLDAFYVDRYEVTNAFYAICVNEGVCKPPTQMSSSTEAKYYGNPTYDDFPVIYITWEMAKTYCEWRGARLLTEAEWEKAARGTDGRIYPWGNEADRVYANYDSEIGDTTSIGSYENGKSIYGIYDMAGNVWEWVADWYSDEYYRNSPLVNPLGPDLGEHHLLRGGSWYDPPYLIRTTIRLMEPVLSDNNFGIRCAKDAN